MGKALTMPSSASALFSSGETPRDSKVRAVSYVSSPETSLSLGAAPACAPAGASTVIDPLSLLYGGAVRHPEEGKSAPTRQPPPAVANPLYQPRTVGGATLCQSEPSCTTIDDPRRAAM